MKYLNDVTTKDCVGKILKSKNFGEFKVLKCNGWKNVEIEFLKTGYRKVAEMKEVKCGSIKDPYLPSIYGKGFVGTKYCTTKENGKNKPEYETWSGVLKRCYSDARKKKRPTYKDCICSDNFNSYEYFYEWCNTQIGFNKTDEKGRLFHLDKDLLVKGSKVYSEDTCVFLPVEINSVLTKTDKLRGDYPIGVHWCNSKKVFVAQINRNKGQQDYLGQFDNPNDAFLAYKKAKESYLKELAYKWKERIDPRAYKALMNYKVEITD